MVTQMTARRVTAQKTVNGEDTVVAKAAGDEPAGETAEESASEPS